MRSLRLYLVATLLLLGAWAAITILVPAPLPAGENIKSYLPTPIFTTLNGGITSGTTSITVSDATKLYDTTKAAYAFRISIDQEYLYVTSVSGNTLTIGPPPEAPTGTGRGIEGSTAASHSSGASVRAPATAMTWLNAYEMATGVIVATNHAVLPTNSAATNSTNMAALIAAAPITGAEFYFPDGTYNFSSTLNFSRLDYARLRGSGFRAGSSSGATIQGNVTGGVVEQVADGLVYIGGAGGKFNQSWFIEGLNFVNLNTTSGAAFKSDNMNNCEIRNCKFTGNYGVVLVHTIEVGLYNVSFSNSLSTYPNGIGIVGAASPFLFACCDFSGWFEAGRLTGSGVGWYANRIEACTSGLRLGVNPDGTIGSLNQSHFSSGEYENNSASTFELASVVNSTFDNITINPHGGNIDGFLITSAEECTFRGLTSSGFTGFGVRVIGATRLSFKNCKLGAAQWAVICDPAQVSFEECDQPITLTDSVTNTTYFSQFRQRQFAELDFLTPAVEGKNVCGSIALGNGVSTVAFAFTGATHGTGNSTVFSATPTTGGTLAANTYFYAASSLTAHGECNALYQPVAAVVSGGNNANNILWSNGSPGNDGFKRHLFRGRPQYSYTDLASTNGTTNPSIVTSVARPFTSADVNRYLYMTAGTNWTAPAMRQIVSVNAGTGAATLDNAAGSAASLSGGTGALGGGKMDWDGFYELGLNSSPNPYLDTGGAFTSVRPPIGPGIDATSKIEPDANYIVLVTPTWATNVSVPTATILTTGFTANFGTATPDANQKIFYIVGRGPAR